VTFEAPGGLPAGVVLDPTTGVISGVPEGPTQSGTHAIVRRSPDGSHTTDLGISIADPLVLVDAGTQEAPVHWWGGDDERRAAELLATYLNRISGRSGFRATAGPSSVPSRGLLVGPVPFGGFELAGTGPEDEFVVRTRGDCVQLTGRLARSTYYAVSTFLERYLGCRFWAMRVPRDGTWEEDVPTRFPLGLPRPNLRVVPAMELRDAGTLEGRDVDYGLRRMSTFSGAALSGSVAFHAGHNMHSLVEDAAYGAYAATHPEIYPCAAPGPGTVAERKRNNVHLCYTDPGLPQALANALAIDVEAKGRDLKHWIYFVGQGDWYDNQCQCDRCRAVYETETWTNPRGGPELGYSGTLLRMMNRVAEILDARYPGIRLGTFAYMGTEAPPGMTRPRANLAIRVPHLRHCIVHAIDECEQNRKYREHLTEWTRIDQGGGVYVWDYSQLFPDGFFYTAPNIYSLARNLKVYASLGVRGAYMQGCNVSPGGDFGALKNWLFSKLMVDPRLEVDDLVAEFCLGYYGEAGPHILDFVRTVRDGVYDPAPVNHHNEFAKIADLRSTWLTNGRLQQLTTLRAQALSAVANDPERTKRVLEATMSVRAFEIYVTGEGGNGTGVGSTGPLSEGVHNGKPVLIRQNMGRYTFDEAVEMMENCRLTSPHEFSNGYKPREIQLALQGGPLAILAQGNVEVKVAPALRGQLRQVSYKGVPCLHIASIQDGYDTYPVAAGSLHVFNPQTHTFRMMEAPSGATVRLEGNVGIGSWGGDLSTLVDGIARHTVRVVDDGSNPARVETDCTIQATPLGNRPFVQATIETTYKVTQDPGAHSVSYDVSGGIVLVRLPGQAWSIRDSYAGATVTGITAVHDPVRGTLRVQVALAQVDSVKEGETTYLRRKVEFVEP
jgi:hypothetical protein